MIDFKKMDDKDFVFISKSVSDKEEKEFSAFLKTRKKKATRALNTNKAEDILNQ